MRKSPPMQGVIDSMHKKFGYLKMAENTTKGGGGGGGGGELCLSEAPLDLLFSAV